MKEIKVGEYCRTDTGYIYIMKNFIKEFDYSKTKHSFNIIDLIEVGDYVNGHKVVNEIWGEDDNNLYFEIEGGFNKAQYIGEKNIKSICTKEQFAAVEYKLDN